MKMPHTIDAAWLSNPTNHQIDSTLLSPTPHRTSNSMVLPLADCP
jgi:hypothetical protein